MHLPPIIQSEGVITFLKPFGKDFRLNVGEVVKAEVLNVMDSGSVSLKVTRKNGESSIIVAKSSTPLATGSTASFRVSGGDNEIKLQLMGTATDGSRTSGHAEEPLADKILRVLSEFTGSRLKQEDLDLIGELFRALPGKVKSSMPELNALQRMLPEAGKLNPELLMKSVGESGVLFETMLKIAVRDGDPEKLGRLLRSDDHKLALLRLKAALEDEAFMVALYKTGLKADEISATVDKLIRNIEFFQVSSSVNDAVYTFLPLTWHGLSEGELCFKKGMEGMRASYTCEINLDLDPMGRLSVSVTLFEGGFYLTFHAEETGAKELISKNREHLERKFSEAGLTLKALNISRKKDIAFGPERRQGLDIKA